MSSTINDTLLEDALDHVCDDEMKLSTLIRIVNKLVDKLTGGQRHLHNEELHNLSNYLWMTT